MRLVWFLVGVIALATWPTAVMANPPKAVSVRIQVIEARLKGGRFEPRLASLKKALPGYEGAKLVDEVQTYVEPNASVSIQILHKSQMLKVTVKQVLEDGTIKLHLELAPHAKPKDPTRPTRPFSADTTHGKGNATALVGFRSEDGASMFLAVTPKGS